MIEVRECRTEVYHIGQSTSDDIRVRAGFSVSNAKPVIFQYYVSTAKITCKNVYNATFVGYRKVV